MKLQLREMAALVACLAFLCTQSASAQRQREYQTASQAAEMAGASLASYNSFDACGGSCDSGCCDGDSCDSGCCGSGLCGGGGGLGIGNGFLDRPGQIFAGAEYIYARASFSEALAYVENDINALSQDYVEYDFDYSSSYRFYGGYRFCDCGAEIVFDYARFRSEADFNVADSNPGNQSSIRGPYEVDAPNGGTLGGSADVDIQSYGLGLAKTIPLGSPLCCDSGCDCGDSCCDDSCGGCCWCPAWDITWYGGFRYAEAGWSRSSAGVFSAADGGGIDTTALTRLSFEGAGARVGLMGRRYLGLRGLASVYCKGDLSLLVGDMDIRTDTQDVGNGTPLTAVHQNSARRVIPITEIEAGVSAHLGNHITLSSGYFIAAWHDLGMRDTYHFGDAFQLGHYDDANILGFDGFFARAEVAY